MSEPLILIMLGIGGVLFHCLIKMNNLRNLSLAANVPFHWYRCYVKSDFIAIIISLLSVFFWYFAFGEVGKKYPIVVDLKRCSFIFAGICGSVIIQTIADKIVRHSADNQIKKMVDVKTNISDSVTGPTATLKETIEKGKVATGQDPSPTPKQ